MGILRHMRAHTHAHAHTHASNQLFDGQLIFVRRRLHSYFCHRLVDVRIKSLTRRSCGHRWRRCKGTAGAHVPPQNVADILDPSDYFWAHCVVTYRGDRANLRESVVGECPCYLIPAAAPQHGFAGLRHVNVFLFVLSATILREMAFEIFQTENCSPLSFFKSGWRKNNGEASLPPSGKYRLTQNEALSDTQHESCA